MGLPHAPIRFQSVVFRHMEVLHYHLDLGNMSFESVNLTEAYQGRVQKWTFFLTI